MISIIFYIFWLVNTTVHFALLQKFPRLVFTGYLKAEFFASNLTGQTSTHCSSEKQRVIATQRSVNAGNCVLHKVHPRKASCKNGRRTRSHNSWRKFNDYILLRPDFLLLPHLVSSCFAPPSRSLELCSWSFRRMYNYCSPNYTYTHRMFHVKS